MNMERLTSPTIPWAIILIVTVSAIVGAIADPARRGLDAMFYEAFPVLDMKTSIVEIGTDYVVLEVEGKKRWACQFDPPPIAELTMPSGARVDVNVTRMDRQESGATRPIGRIAPQRWMVYPIEGADAVTIYANHLCDGRLVSSVFGSADLTMRGAK